MRLSDFYRKCVCLGEENDPRSFTEVERVTSLARKKYEALKEEDKPYFDQEQLENPYADTRILNGDPQTEIKRILVGIDLETPELILADRLREKGEKIDLVLSHHPEGQALVALYKVMALQEDLLAQLGVPINVAEGILASRISEVARGLMPLNHERPIDAARLLDLPFMCVHTPADNMVTTYLTNFFTEKKPQTLEDVLTLLGTIPEYQQARKKGAGPKILLGKKENRAGKLFVDMTGGTGGAEEAYAQLAVAGVGTVIGMHIGEKHRKAAEKNHINVIIAGHMASDSLGMNLLLDHFVPEGLELLPCSGFIRISR